MTDARHPERWLNDRRIQQLSSEAFFAFSNALLWSVSNRTDGVIKFAELELIPRCKPADADELAAAGLWKRRRDGWMIADFGSTQRSRKQLESDDEYRERERERVRQLRAARREETTSERANVRAYERTDNIGQGRAGHLKGTNNESVDGEKSSAAWETPATDADGFPLDDWGHR